jgi:hypothetical protein
LDERPISCADCGQLGKQFNDGHLVRLGSSLKPIPAHGRSRREIRCPQGFLGYLAISG